MLHLNMYKLKKMLRNLIEKLRAKFPATSHGYSMAKIACLYVGLITSCCLGKEPELLSPKHGWTREDFLLVLTNQITTRTFLLGINYLVSLD